MEFKDHIDKYESEMIQKLCGIVSIPSVEGKAEDNKPFGPDVDRALKYTLDLCESIGLSTENIDNYAGHADFGTGDETIGIVLHLDVVPAGDGWTYRPFEPKLVDGRIYGRGTTDNKGPLIAILYAVKAIMESGVKLDKKIRIIFGTNEETRWEGINYYLNKVAPPDFTIVPDGLFPMIYAEKGIVDIEMKASFDDRLIKVESFKGGNALNSVPDSCEIELSADVKTIGEISKSLEAIDIEEGFSLESSREDQSINIRVKGVPAHAAVPEKGKNAIGYMGSLLTSSLPEYSGIYRIAEFIEGRFPHWDYNGDRAGIYCQDEPSGKITNNLATLNLEGNSVVLGCNVRYPVTMDYQGFQKKMDELAEKHGWELNITDHLKPVYHPLDSPEVKSLINIYREESGDYKSQPISFGAGTYARALPNAVTFGGQMQSDQVEPHQDDEYTTVNNLMMMTRIYARSIYELAK